MAESIETTIATRPGSPAAAALRQTADTVSRTFAPCERSCLDIGARLGDAIPVLSDLSGLFQELSKSLDSEELRAAGLDLQTVSDQIEATANDLSEESQALADLVALNQAIAERIANLSESGRTISMLVFNVKIEAASLSGLGEDMRGFVEGLHQLAERAQQALNQYRLTHAKLYDLLRDLQRSAEALSGQPSGAPAVDRQRGRRQPRGGRGAAAGNRRGFVGNRLTIATHRRPNRSMRDGAASRRQHMPANRTRARGAACRRARVGAWGGGRRLGHVVRNL